MKGKYLVKVYDVLCAAADRDECIPTLRQMAVLVGCPVTGRGRISQVIASLETQGDIRRVLEDGVTVQVEIIKTGALTQHKCVPRLPVNYGRKHSGRGPKVPDIKRPSTANGAKAPSRPAKPATFARPSEPPRKTGKVAPLEAAAVKGFSGCQWIQNEPKDREFCGIKTLLGSPWCEAHYARVYLYGDRQKEQA